MLAHGGGGTLTAGAACAPSQIWYPQDVSLLNAACEDAEEFLSLSKKENARGDKLRGAEPFGSAPLFICFTIGFYCSAISRQRNVTIWARVQTFSGEKFVPPVPLVMPFSTAQRTALP